MKRSALGKVWACETEFEHKVEVQGLYIVMIVAGMRNKQDVMTMK